MDDQSNLYFCRDEICDDDADRICTALDSHAVQVLTIRKCEVNDANYTRILKSMRKCRSLLQLGLLEGVVNTYERLRKLAKALQSNKNLRTLYIAGSTIGDADCGLLMKALAQHANIVSLDLGECQLGDVAVKYICDLMPPTQDRLGLKEISLTGNPGITIKGWTKLSIAVAASSTLRVLKLDNNKIEDHGAGCLSVAMAANPELTFVSLEQTAISDNGAKFFLNLLNNYPSCLKTLKLGDNNIKEKTLDNIKKCLELEEELRRKCLEGNHDSSDGEETAEEIQETKAENVSAGILPTRKVKKKDDAKNYSNYYSAWNFGGASGGSSGYGVHDPQTYAGQSAPGMMSGFALDPSVNYSYPAAGNYSSYNPAVQSHQVPSSGVYGYDQMGYGASGYGAYNQYGYGLPPPYGAAPTAPQAYGTPPVSNEHGANSTQSYPYGGISAPYPYGSSSYAPSSYGDSSYGVGSYGIGSNAPTTYGSQSGHGSQSGQSGHGSQSGHTPSSIYSQSDYKHEIPKSGAREGHKNIGAGQYDYSTSKFDKSSMGNQGEHSSYKSGLKDSHGDNSTSKHITVKYGEHGKSDRYSTDNKDIKTVKDEINIRPETVTRHDIKTKPNNAAQDRSKVLKIFEDLMKEDATDDDLNAMKHRLGMATPPKVRDLEADFQKGRIVPLIRGRPSKMKHLGTVASLSDSEDDY